MTGLMFVEVIVSLTTVDNVIGWLALCKAQHVAVLLHRIKQLHFK